MFLFIVFYCVTILIIRFSLIGTGKLDILPFKKAKRVHVMSTMRHHRRRVVHRPMRTKSFSVIASISKSIHKCHCRVIKFVCKRHQCSVVLNREKPNIMQPNVEPSSAPRAVVTKEHRDLLPPIVPGKKGTIVLDLDETLVHSVTGPPPPNYDFIVTPNFYGATMNFYVLKRPGVDEFLEAISKKYEIVVFTAGLEQYASLLLDLLDPKGLISHRLYRDSCNQTVRMKFIKDLSKIGRDLGKVVIVDDNPRSYALQPENGIPIKKFEDDFEDRELEKLLGFFEMNCDGFDDMRDAVKQHFGGAPAKKADWILIPEMY